MSPLRNCSHLHLATLPPCTFSRVTYTPSFYDDTSYYYIRSIYMPRHGRSCKDGLSAREKRKIEQERRPISSLRLSVLQRVPDTQNTTENNQNRLQIQSRACQETGWNLLRSMVRRAQSSSLACRDFKPKATTFPGHQWRRPRL